MNSKYLPHVNGLRALAILPVVIYHFFPNLLPGGYAGVDVFFVISGFLISKGIFEKLDDDKFNFKDFYIRRIRRIAPVYLFLVFTVTIITSFSYSLVSQNSIYKTVLWSLIDSANVYFYTFTSYFALNAQQNPLLHLWSLGVEEQFYLVIPLIIWLTWKLDKNKIIYLLILLFTLSFVSSIYSLKGSHSEYAFYMLPERIWEFVAGILLAFLQNNKLLLFKKSDSLFIIGLLLVIFPYFEFNNKTVFPGFAALPSVVGSLIILTFAQSSRFNIILSNRIFEFIGYISYSLYLWHWPIFVLFIHSDSTVFRKITFIILSFIISILSWVFIEENVRKSNYLKSNILVFYFFAASIIIGIYSYCFIRITSNDSSLSKVRDWAGNITIWPKSYKNIDLWPQRDDEHMNPTQILLNNVGNKYLINIGLDKVKKTFVLWGDSHALALLFGMDFVASEYSKSGYFVNVMNSFTTIKAHKYDGRTSREPTLRWIENNTDIKSIYLANRWTLKLASQNDIDEVFYICNRLKNAGKIVYFFTSAPEISENALNKIEQKTDEPLISMSIDFYNSRNQLELKLIDQLAKYNLAKIIPLQNVFYDGDKHFRTGIRTEGSSKIVSFYADQQHLSQFGSIYAVQGLGELLFNSSINDKSFNNLSLLNDKKNNNSLDAIKLAAEDGFPDPQYQLGMAYYNGEGVLKKIDEAIHLFTLSANQGYPQAELILGLIYYQGIYRPKDVKLACLWWSKAGMHGQGWAEIKLASMYYNGDEITKDTTQAFKWCDRASKEGYPDAQNFLGFMYLNGLGCAQDLELAYVWFSISSHSGNKDAVNNLNLLVKRLNIDQKNKADLKYKSVLNSFFQK